MSDTVLAEADVYVYRISVIPDDNIQYDELRYKNPSAFNRKTELQQKNAKHIYDSISLLLKNKGYTFLPPNTPDTFNIITGAYRVFSADILLHSSDSLSALYQQLKNTQYLVGTIEVAKAQDESGYQKVLYKKLLNEAADKVRSIASFSNQAIGGIQLVVENKTDEKQTGGWSAYPPLSALSNSVIPGWHTTINPGISILVTDVPFINKYPIRGSLTIRYSIE